MGKRRSALANMIAESILPAMQQMGQQNSAAVIQAIQSIPQPQGIDPMFIRQIEQAVGAIGQVDIMPVVAAVQNMSAQLDALAMADERPTNWHFDIKRDPQTHFVTSVEVSPA